MNDMFDSCLTKFDIRIFQYVLFLVRRWPGFSCLEQDPKFHLRLWKIASLPDCVYMGQFMHNLTLHCSLEGLPVSLKSEKYEE